MTLLTALALAASVNPTTGTDEEFGTAEEAEALVVKAVAHVRSVGAQKAYQDFTSKASDFVELRGPDGNPWIKERVKLARTKNKFWQDYKFRDPITKETLSKSTYCERLESTVICAGIYKR